MTLLALGGVFVVGGWLWMAAAVVLGTLSLYHVREIVELANHPAELVVDGNELTIPLRSFGRWTTRRVVLGPGTEMMRQGRTLTLFEKNENPGGLVGVGAINADWFEWRETNFDSFVASLHGRSRSPVWAEQTEQEEE